MLVVVRVVLHGLNILIRIREADVVAVGTIGDGDIVVLIETSAEYFVPLVAADRSEGTLCAVEVCNLLVGVEACTIGVIGLTVRSNDSIAVTVDTCVTETGQSLLVVVTEYPVVITRTELCLHVGHVGNVIPADIGIEVNVCTCSVGTLLGGDHDDTVVTFRTVERCCGSTLQHGDALNVLRVDVDETVSTDALVGPVAFVVRVTVADGHTVHNDERLGVT